MKKLATLLVVLAILSGFAATTNAQDDDWWKAAAAPYQGVTLHGISESTPPSNFAADVLAPQFEALTGIKVELEPTSWDQMYDKAIKDMEAGSGIYDFVYIEQDIVYSYLAQDYLVDITQALLDKPELKAPSFDEAKFTSFIDNFRNAEGHLFGVPMEAFIKIYLYRSDLFEDPDIQAAFEAEYGYPLAPATTHEQYTDIAKFFTQYGKDNDLQLWGTTVQGNTGHSSSFYELVESVFPTFGVYNWGINMDNWKATVADGGEMNSDTAKAAFQWWVDLLDYAPPEATASTWDEVAASFAAGRAAQGLVYGENTAWIASNSEKSQVVDKVTAAIPPLEPGVLEAAEAGTGYVGYYDGGAFGIPHSSKNKEATLLWLQFIGQENVQADWAEAGSRIVMNSTYSDPKVIAMDEQTHGYYSLMMDQGYLFRGAPPFPFHAQVRSVVEPFVWQALAGEISVSDALDQAAVAANEEMARLGYGS